VSRPPFSLTDDQARDLLQGVAPLLERYPLDPRDHRPFLRAFLRVVHSVTGKLYGPDIYRRLLRAYAPGRNPSTSTIASERDDLERELAAVVPAGAPALSRTCLVPAGGQPDGASMRTLIRTAFLPSNCRSSLVSPLRLAATPRSTIYRRGCARPNAGRPMRKRSGAPRRRAAGTDRARRPARPRTRSEPGGAIAAAGAVTSLTEELKGQRQFAMQAIEMARGESRLIKERTLPSCRRKIDRLETTIDQLRMARGNVGGMR
jgi:hypothetical protein